MIRRIQALNYRCFRHVDVSLDRFHVLVGPNASGKSTLFDVVSFLGDMVRDGLRVAVDKRTRNFQDLAWGRPRTDPGFELAVELTIPEPVKRQLPRGPQGDELQAFRYEVVIDEQHGEVRATHERGLLVGAPARKTPRPGPRFPTHPKAPTTIMNGGGKRGSRTVFSQDRRGERVFRPETTPRARRNPVTGIPFGSSGLAASPGNISSALYPAASHVIYMLAGFVDRVVLDDSRLRSASPLDCDRAFTRDGASLPWNVRYLREIQEDDYREWIRHVQTVLPELEDIRVVEREDDRHAYLMLRYANGVEVPSWMTSDGTLKFLALTLFAYLPVAESYPHDRRFLHEIILIEEPEDGVHPLALDAIYDSLTSVYNGQVLVTTHSPTFLGLAGPEEALCFARTADGSIDVIRGTDHPHLKDWHGTADMNLLFATGVIG
jgi:predicted ATPase